MSPTVRRLALELTDRQAGAIAEAVAHNGGVAPAILRLQGTALADVYRIVVDEVGQRTRDGKDNAAIVDAVGAIVAHGLNELDRWFAVSAHRSQTGPDQATGPAVAGANAPA